MRSPQARGATRPPGYPDAYESVARLGDGRVVHISPIVPGDVAELAEAIRTADPETLRSRFLGGPPPLTDAVMTMLTSVDYVTRFALVARSEDRGVAIARYAAAPRAPDGTMSADVAVAVRPEWRGVGLATVLVAELARRAQECGITHFTALFSAANKPVVELAHDASAQVVIDRGVGSLDAPIASTPGRVVPKRFASTSDSVTRPGRRSAARRAARGV